MNIQRIAILIRVNQLSGYDKNVIKEYNEFVEKKIKHVSEILEIDINKFMPKDKHGKARMLGLFEFEKTGNNDHTYEEFITQGAKKYAYTEMKENSKIKDSDNVVERGKEKSKVLKITVAGVPKKGASALKSLEDFKDDFLFDYEHTGKNLIVYVEDQPPRIVTDYLGNEYKVTDKTGCCLLPTTYVLGKALEYCELITDSSSKRAIYKE